MRTFVQLSLSAVALATLALACGNSEQAPARSPANDPAPHGAAWGPGPNDPTSPNPHTSRPPLTDPSPQRAAIEPAAKDPGGETLAGKPTIGAGTAPPLDRSLAKSEKPLSDAEVLGVLLAANSGEVLVADFAIRKLSAADVQAFATMMKSHHQSGVGKTRALGTKIHVEGSDSDLTTYLKADAENAIKEMRERDGAQLERIYMKSQVKAHRELLAAIDNRLAPSVTNGELKSLVAETRRQIADHLTRAEDIQKKLDPGAAAHHGAPPKRETAGASGEARATLGLGLPEPKDPGPTPPGGKHDNQAAKVRASDHDAHAKHGTGKQPPHDKQH
jgi:putative membrane protein